MPPSHNIRILTWFNFFSHFKFYGPIAILYFAQISGSFALGMSVFSIVFVSSALFEVPTGIFSDRIGRKKTIVYGTVAGLASVIVYAVAQNYWWLVVGAILAGLTRSFYSGNNEALLYDTLAENDNLSEFHRYFGRSTSTTEVALAVSAIAGGVLASISFPLTYWLTAGSSIVCLVLSLQFHEPKIHTRKTGNVYAHLKEALIQFKNNRKLRLLTYGSSLSTGMGEASFQFESAFFQTVWPVWAIGLAKSFSSFFSALSFWFSDIFINRFGAVQLLIFSGIYARIVKTIALVFASVVSPLLISSSSIFFGTNEVSKSTLNQKEFTNEQRATMGSLISLLGSLFFGVFAILLGLIADSTGPTNALLVTQLCMVSITYLYWRVYKHENTRGTPGSKL